MAGIYLHIPFCKKACHYCDFHFSTDQKNRPELLAAMQKELLLRNDFLRGEIVETIYLGGGTPSLLSAHEMNSMLELIFDLYKVSSSVEISIEANPDDLSTSKIAELRKTLINRFSVGIQSFFDEDLSWMNRTHTALEAYNSIQELQHAGFENLSIDLIYGYPLLSGDKWERNLETALDLRLPHLSCYAMTVEPATALDSFIRRGKTPPIDEGQSAAQFEYMCEALGQAGYEHYEISNFAWPDRHSIHNSNYWKSKPYLGIGPSAHSFTGSKRSWNISNNHKYIQQISQGIDFSQEFEELSVAQRLNEYIMLSLRTMWGLDFNVISERYDSSYLPTLKTKAQKYIEQGFLEHRGNRLYLTEKAKLLADKISLDLFF